MLVSAVAITLLLLPMCVCIHSFIHVRVRVCALIEADFARVVAIVLVVMLVAGVVI